VVRVVLAARVGPSLLRSCDPPVSRVFRDGYGSGPAAVRFAVPPSRRSEASLSSMPSRTVPDDDGAGAAGTGLPATGPGSAAPLGRRVAAYLVDSVVSALIAALFVPDPVDVRRGILTLGVFVLQYLLLGSLTGQTIGMRLLGLRMVRPAEPGAPPGFLAMAIRTALLVLLVPAVVMDRDNRGLHDRAAQVVVVRDR